jgi:hypothetical protein
MPTKSGGTNKIAKRDVTVKGRSTTSKRIQKFETNGDDDIQRFRTTSIPVTKLETCTACKHVREALNDFLRGDCVQWHDIKLGNLGSLAKQSSCLFCQSILSLSRRWLAENAIPFKSQYSVVLEPSYNSQGEASPTKLCVGIGNLCDYPPAGPELNIIPLESISPSKPHGRLVNPQWVDTSIIRTWIECCDRWHAGHCHSVDEQKKLPWPSHIRLIDVHRGCLVRGLSGDKYVALSYVWGKVNNRAHQFHTTESNLREYETEGILTDKTSDVPIPQTVKDAMRLVSLLGERYLWVDCFCIVQDNATALDFQINQMGSIFANATFTIIAADGDNADDGIRGIEGGSQPREVLQEIFEYCPGKHMLGLTSNMFEFSVWNRRGWTFQEKLFSRRKLILSNGMARWMCHCIEWSEDINAEAEEVTGLGYCENLSEVGAFVLRNAPDASFTEYAQLVNEYGETELTHDVDVLSAFSGITSSLSRSFVGGFYYGLPEMFFDLALLWQPTTPNMRRQNEGEHSEDFLPSWSWAGWKGARGYTHLGWALGSAREDDVEPSWELTSTVNWYKMGANSENKTKVCNSWQDYRSSCSDTSKPLPPGWSRHRVKKRKSKTALLYYYKYESDPKTIFRFPIPMQSHDQTNEMTSQKWRPYVHGHTSRAQFYTGPKCTPHPIPPDQCLPICLLDSNGLWAGILYLNHLSSQPLPPSFAVDLIALSEGYAKNGSDESFYFAEWDYKGRPKDNDLYKFVNVLHIEWKDKVAYRRGIGRVMKETWEEQDLEWGGITLG